MQIVQRKIANRFHIFDKENNTVVLDISKCVNRIEAAGTIHTIRNTDTDLDDIGLMNIPIGLTLACIAKGYSIVITDGERYLHFFNKSSITRELLVFIDTNYNKIKNHAIQRK